MEIVGLKLWQALTVVVIAGISSLGTPSPGFAIGSALGVALVLWTLVASFRRGTPQQDAAPP